MWVFTGDLTDGRGERMICRGLGLFTCPSVTPHRGQASPTDDSSTTLIMVTAQMLPPVGGEGNHRGAVASGASACGAAGVRSV